MSKKELIVVGIIPARGGSKGVPLKNIKELCGKPLLAYTIESAKRSGCINKLCVSTDHDSIARVAEELGVCVIRRPDELSTDEATTEAALIHALDELKKTDNFTPDIVLTLEPTSPFRSEQTIKSCVELFRNDPRIDSVIGVVQTKSSLGKILNGKFQFLFPGQPRRRQDREPLYKESSTIYATKAEVLRKAQSVLGDFLVPLVVPENEAIDINTPFDFMVAELYMKLKNKGDDKNAL